MKYKARFSFALALFFVSTSPQAAIVENSNNGHFYELVLVDGGISWEDANIAANSRPGNWHLATITDATENAFIENLLSPGVPFFEASCLTSNLVGRVCGGIWLGGKSSSNASQDWGWVTGEAWSFTDWGPTAPFGNGDGLRIDEFRDQGPQLQAMLHDQLAISSRPMQCLFLQQGGYFYRVSSDWLEWLNERVFETSRYDYSPNKANNWALKALRKKRATLLTPSYLRRYVLKT